MSPNRKNPASRSNAERAQNMPLPINWDADAAAGWLYNGRWADFATGDKGGDVVSLVAHLEGVSQGEAARRLARMLGLEIGGRRHG